MHAPAARARGTATARRRFIALSSSRAGTRGQRRDDLLAEPGERLRGREVAEPGVDPLDALLGEAPVVIHQLGTGSDHRAGVAEAPRGQRGYGLAVAASFDEGHHLLDGHPGIPDPGPEIIDLAQVTDVDVPPVGEVPYERQRPGPRAADDDRDAAERERSLPGVPQLVVAALVVDGLARPERTQHLQRLPQPLDTLARLGRAHAEGHEFVA